MARPPRNRGISYIGRDTFMVTALAMYRVTAFKDNEFAAMAIAQLLKQAARHRFSVPAYTYMPDHAHVVVTGLTATSDLEIFVNAWKQATGFDWSRACGRRLWQPGYWDRRLRDNGSIADFIEYVIMNPVRAGIVDHPSKYPFTGSSIHTMQEMIEVIGAQSGTKVPPSR